MKTFVIAEAGSCHDGTLTKAFPLVDVAAAAGADAVKFQFWSSADRMAERRRASKALREIYARYQVIPEWLPLLRSRCELAGVEFMCSIYLPEDVATVAPFVKRFKIASFEAMDEELARAHDPFLRARELIVSLGMSAPLDRWRYSGHGLLHCVSAYPAPVDALNLRVLHVDLDGRSPFSGFSDHSDPALTWTGALAVAAGAEIVEAHLRLDDTDPANPDAPHAMTPAQFADYVRNIRFAEACLGDGERQLQPCEREMAQYRVGVHE